MRCEVCGQEYGLTHNCPGPIAAATEARAAALEPPPPLQLAPILYFKKGLAIARWDELAIQRASRDNNALLHGALFYLVGVLLIFALQVFRALNRGTSLSILGVILGAVTVAVFGFVWQLAYFGACNFLVKKLLGGTGTFLGILRPMLLSSFVLWLAVIPFLGLIAAGGWWGIAILLWVFEEVHQVERLKTLAILVALNVLFTALRFGLLGARAF